MMHDDLDIPAIRKVLRLTQSELADRAGVNISTVWRWENGSVPKRGTARAFLDQLATEAAAITAAEQVTAGQKAAA